MNEKYSVFKKKLEFGSSNKEIGTEGVASAPEKLKAQKKKKTTKKTPQEVNKSTSNRQTQSRGTARVK